MEKKEKKKKIYEKVKEEERKDNQKGEIGIEGEKKVMKKGND